jgi:hypothetical protein
MPIVVGHSPDPGLIGEVAYQAGAGQARQRNQQIMLEQQGRDEWRRMQESMPRIASDLRLREAEINENRRAEMTDSYRRRAEAMAQEVNKVYQSQRDMTPDEMNQALRIVQSRYADLPQDMQQQIMGDPYRQRKPHQEEWPSVELEDGRRMPMVRGKDGQPDEFETWDRIDKQRRERERIAQEGAAKGEAAKQKEADAAAKLRSDRAKYIADLMKMTTESITKDGVSKTPMYSLEEAKRIADEVFGVEQPATAQPVNPANLRAMYDKHVHGYESKSPKQQEAIKRYLMGQAQDGDQGAAAALEMLQGKDMQVQVEKAMVEAPKVEAALKKALASKNRDEYLRLRRELEGYAEIIRQASNQ